MWLWELISTSVALVSALAIFLLLFFQNGQLLRDWSFYFTLNSIISALVTVWRLAIGAAVSPAIFQLGYVWFTQKRPLNDLEIFDTASRGIVGSVQMIWLQRGRGLASLGAFLIILMVSSDAFIQQVVMFPEQEVIRDLAAEIGRNTIYDEWMPGEEMDVKSIALSMVAAILTGLYNTDVSSVAIKPICPTGNCTWPLVYTQAIRSKCTILDYLVESTGPANTTSQNCTFSLPNGGPSLNGDQVLLNSTTVILDSDHYNKSTMIFPHIPRQLSTFQTIARSKANYTNVTAMQCILYLSIDTYNVSVVNGTLNEQLVSTWTDNTFIAPGTPDWVSNPRQIPGGPYRLSYSSAIALQNYFWMLFSGSVLGSSGTSISSSDTMALLAALMSEGTLATRMDNLALAMTYHLRRWRAPSRTTDSDENTVFGEAKDEQAYIHVNWFWFTLPASVPCLTLALLLSTMHLTQKNSLSTFKSSPVALLFAGPTDKRRARFERMEDISQMLRRTENFVFIIQNEGTGLRFVPRRRSTGSIEMV
jgi:Protein of unknown function (DUF3176)